MGKLLEAFTNNELYATEVIQKRSPKRQKLLEKSDKLYEKLRKKYNEKDKEILEQLLELVSEEGCCYAQDNFMRGYCLGALMTIEIFSEQNSFF